MKETDQQSRRWHENFTFLMKRYAFESASAPPNPRGSGLYPSPKAISKAISMASSVASSHRLQGELQSEHPQPAGEIIPAQDSNMTPSIDSMSPISSPDPLPPPSLHPDNGIFKLLEGRPLDVCDRWIRECIETLPESFKETVRNPPGKTTREFEESNEGSEKLAALPFLDARALLSSVDTPERTFPSPGSDEPSEAVSYKDIVRISDLISKLHTDMHKDIAKMQRDLRAQLDLQDRIMKKSMQMSHLYSVVSPLLSGYGNILKNIEWKTPGESESGDPEPGELRMKQEPVEPSLDHQPPNTA
ncbi:unnamed protein product [Penicillium bialowiezense]